MKRKIKVTVSVILLTAVLLFTVSAYAATIGAATASSIGMPDELIEYAVKDAKLGWIRDSVCWASLSYTEDNGIYTLNPMSVQSKKEFFKKLKSEGANIMFVLSFGNTASHLNNSSVYKIPTVSNSAYWNGWREYVQLIATEFKGIVDVYEVWNEQDHKPFNDDVIANSESEDAEVMSDYAALLKQTYTDVKAIDPDVIVTPGGFANGATYVDDFLNAVGNVKCFDAFAIHAYNHGNYSSLETKFRNSLNVFLNVLNSYGYNGDVNLTENGWFTGTANNSLTEQQQAAALIRNKIIWDDFLADNSRDGVYIWYDAINNGNRVNYNEANFGLYDYKADPKIAAKAARTYNAFLGDKEFVSLTESGSSARKVYKAEYVGENGSKTYVVWGYSSTMNIANGMVYNADGTLSGESSTSIRTSKDNPKFINVDIEGTSIIDCSYNPETNMISVSGRAYKKSGDVEIYLMVGDGEASVFAPQDEYGYFNTEISAPDTGDAEVYANYEGYVEVTVDGTFADEVSASAITGAGAMYNSANNTVTVNATLAGCSENETLKILVAPFGAASITSENIAYIDEIAAINGAKNITFNLPEDIADGKYNVYLRLTNSDKVSDTIYNNLIEVGSFVYGSGASTITATASDIGYDAGVVSDAVIVIAQYDANGILIDIDISTKGISSDEKSFTANIANGATEIRAMLIQGVDSIKPICNMAVSE